MDENKLTLVKELHRPARKNYLRRHVSIRDLDETWQADLVDMSAYAKDNGGYNYLLTVIDTFSKYAWALPIKRKNADDVSNAMESVFKQHGRVPKNLHVDAGKEFYNTKFKDLMRRYNVNLYSTFSNLKASICERFNRTLKNKMWMQFSLRGNYKWLDMISDLISSYNDTKHRTIKMRPKDVTMQNAKQLRRRIYKNFNVYPNNKNKFKIGDKVRISKFKHVFEKGYTPNWTTEIFTVYRIQNTDPVTYKLKDYQNQPIEGGFYEQEIAKVKNPDIYLVEKVVKKRGNKVFVKWLGFDNTHNSWISKNDL